MDIRQSHHSGYWRLVAFLILSIFFPRWRPPSWILEMHHEAKCIAGRERSHPLGSFLTPSFSVSFWALTHFPQEPRRYLSRFCSLLSGLSVDCQPLLSVALFLRVIMGVGMLLTKREEKVREQKSSLWSGPSLSLFPP